MFEYYHNPIHQVKNCQTLISVLVLTRKGLDSDDLEIGKRSQEGHQLLQVFNLVIRLFLFFIMKISYVIESYRQNDGILCS